jgi:methyl-accepting chemotaxis protein
MLDEAQGMEDEQEKTRIQNNVVTTYEQELMPVKACTYELIEAVMDLADANARQKNVDNYRTYNNLLWIIGAVMVLAIFIAVLITIKMSGDFTERLGQIQKLALRISEYDLSDDIKETGNDEFGETIAALNESQFMLRNLLEKITTESATIDDIGNEISEAVRKSGQRIEAVNVDLYNVEEMLETLEDKIQKTMTSDNSVEDMVKTLQQIEVQCQDSKDWTQEMQTSLTGIATYLEQIGITAEYQNEIANSHRVQVERFRVSQES